MISSCVRVTELISPGRGLSLKIRMLKIILFIRCHCCVNFLWFENQTFTFSRSHSQWSRPWTYTPSFRESQYIRWVKNRSLFIPSPARYSVVTHFGWRGSLYYYTWRVFSSLFRRKNFVNWFTFATKVMTRHPVPCFSSDSSPKNPAQSINQPQTLTDTQSKNITLSADVAQWQWPAQYMSCQSSVCTVYASCLTIVTLLFVVALNSNHIT